MSEMNDFNRQIIDDFRAHEGRVGGPFAGAPILLLHTKGAKSGVDRTHPLVYQQDGNRYVIFASKGGAPTNPDWFHNLRANPNASIEVGASTLDVTAKVLEGEERDRIFEKQKQVFPQFAEYEQKTPRRIPVVALEPVG
jgi:deazaflavin-dependent oxidoreductase (nitroreductase family)